MKTITTEIVWRNFADERPRERQVVLFHHNASPDNSRIFLGRFNATELRFYDVNNSEMMFACDPGRYPLFYVWAPLPTAPGYDNFFIEEEEGISIPISNH